MKRRYLLCLFILILLASCKKAVNVNLNADATPTASSPSPTETPTPTPSPTPAPQEDLTYVALNPLTGQLTDKSIAERRPFAVVINNLQKALPQSGISQADIYYEVLAEADITRIVAVFQEPTSIKIGPVRSARDYFLDFALDYDAVFVHHGGSPQAYSAIGSLKINNYDGMKDGVIFWRDKARASIPSMIEHSSYINANVLVDRFTNSSYRKNVTDNFIHGFSFLAMPAALNGQTEDKSLTVSFSRDFVSGFVFDGETGLYNVFNGDKKRIDEETGNQLSVTNVVVQFASMRVIPGDSEGRRDVNLVSSGSGYLFTNGARVPIKWEKKSHTSPTSYFFEDGSKAMFNKGKTWFCIVDKTSSVTADGEKLTSK